MQILFTKLLIQELQTMNIQMRIITDENVDQMLSLSYSNNINELLQRNDVDQNDDSLNLSLKTSIHQLKRDIRNNLTRETTTTELNKLENIINDTDSEEKELTNINIDIKPESSASAVPSEDSVPYAPGSPAYEGNSEEIQPGTSSPYAPDMDTELANTPMLIKKPTQGESQQGEQPTQTFMPMTPSISPPSSEPEEKKTILEVEEEKKDTEEKGANEGNEGSQTSNSNETKKIVMTSDNEGDNNTNSNDTKKINL
jgi:hypothetical protein